MRQAEGAVRLSDIARECGVSIATVGKVLNHSARSSARVGAKTAQRILEVAHRLDYQPDLRASSLRNGASRLIGVIIDSVNFEGMGRMLMEIEHQASLHDYQLMISGEHDSIARYRECYQRLQQYGAEGIICVAHDYRSGGEEIYDFLQRNSERVVLVGRPRIGDFWHVDVDYNSCPSQAFEYFVKSGRRRIVGVCFAGQSVDCADYRSGFMTCCRKYETSGIESKMVILQPTVDHDTLYQMLHEVIETEIIDWKCDAIVSQTDFLAGCAIHELQAHGLRIPEDIAIIGHGNDAFDKLITPQLATMDDGLARQGRAAFDLIRRQLGQQVDTIPEGRTVLVAPEFVWRTSAG